MYALHIILGTTVLIMVLTLLASPFLISRDAEKRFNYVFFSNGREYVWTISGIALWAGHYWIVLAEKYNGAYTEKYAWGLIAFGILNFAYVLYKNIKGTNLFYGLTSSLVMIPALAILSSAIVPALILLAFIYVSTLPSAVKEEPFNNDNGTNPFYPLRTNSPLGSQGLMMYEERKQKHR